MTTDQQLRNNDHSPVDEKRLETVCREVTDGHHDDDGCHGDDSELCAEVDECESGQLECPLDEGQTAWVSHWTLVVAHGETDQSSRGEVAQDVVGVRLDDGVDVLPRVLQGPECHGPTPRQHDVRPIALDRDTG